MKQDSLFIGIVSDYTDDDCHDNGYDNTGDECSYHRPSYLSRIICCNNDMYNDYEDSANKDTHTHTHTHTHMLLV